MASSDRDKDGSRPTPDTLTVRAGRVPARWFRKADVQTSDSEAISDACGRDSEGTPSSSSSSTQTETKDVVCELCPHQCRIAEGRVGRCSARVNIDGQLITRFYGRPVSAAIDPIEKKPLYHFLPGTPILSLGTQGCNLSCKFCQNWQISRPIAVQQTVNSVLEPAQVVEQALKRGCPSVAFTYNEPTIWAEYVVDVSRLCRSRGIKTVVVSNGMISGEARKEFYRAVDAANVDLKGFTHEFYQDLSGGNLEDVKSTLKYIARETDVWLEITNLLIPGRNDSTEKLREMCDWIVNELGPTIPLHFSAFFPAWRLTNVAATSLETLLTATEIARSAGIQYVYRGNVRDDAGQTTFCPNCKATLIKRSGYRNEVASTLDVESLPARCTKCGETIAGIFKRD